MSSGQIDAPFSPGAQNGRADPFASSPPGSPPDRPFLLAYVGRWGRARRWLPRDVHRVLDVGCAFAYGSAAVAAGPPARTVVGVEANPEHLERARREYPWVTVLEGDAGALPVSSGTADAVLMLDVLEHLPDPAAAIAEAHRALRPDGVFVLSVPHHGPLRHIDALNVYQALRRRWPSWPPLEPATESAGGEHRHYTVAQITALLGPGFRIDRVARTGLGLEELVYLAALILRIPRRAERVGQISALVHLFVYLIDDLVPWGPLGYTLTVRAHRTSEAGG